MKPEKQRSVSIEDLLRMKRAERPAEEFWADFDRQLRAKQLSALVGKRPWWHDLSLSGMVAGFRRFQLPLGAATIVALAFFSMRATRTETASTPRLADRETVAEVSVLPVASFPGGVEGGMVAGADEKLALSASTEETGGGSAFASDGSNTGGAARYLPSLGNPSDEAPNRTATTAVRYFESAWVAAAATEPMISRSLLRVNSQIEARTMPARPAVEPLRQIALPGERRGSRILTAMVSVAAVENAMRTTERAASRLSEEQLYDQIHRFEARGAGVNVKF